MKQKSILYRPFAFCGSFAQTKKKSSQPKSATEKKAVFVKVESKSEVVEIDFQNIWGELFHRNRNEWKPTCYDWNTILVQKNKITKSYPRQFIAKKSSNSIRHHVR